MNTIRLTMAQALVRYLAAQRTTWQGNEVPLFGEAVALVTKAARVVPEIPYVGWDVAILPDGPVLIEGNYNTGVFQAKPNGVGEYRGLLPRYRAVIGEF